jgi:hypothetical protein
MAEGQWAAGRREAARSHADALARVTAQEQAQARAMLEAFAARAVASGLPQRRLYARNYQGSGRYKTDVVGWYLRRDRSIGADAAGHYSVLQVPGGTLARLRPTHVPPREPPLVVGKGGRDGDAIDLKDLLELRLEAGDDWPS